MHGLCCNEKYGAMTNYDDEDDGRDDDRNEDRNNNNNACFRSGSDGLIFDPTTTS